MINQKNKHKNVQLILIALFVVAFFAIVYYMGGIVEPRLEKEEMQINKRYFDSFNESFRGVIVDIHTPKRLLRGGVKQSLLKVKLDYSTIMHYDPRNSLERYYCIIDFPFAEVFEEYLESTSIGDSITFDGIIDTLFIKWHSWVDLKPDIVDNNIRLLEPFYTIPKYTKEQLAERIKTYPYPMDLPNDYYMLMFGKFIGKNKLIQYYKYLSQKKEYQGRKIPKRFIEKRDSTYYFFINDTRFKDYEKAYEVLQNLKFEELYIVKFDKYNQIREVMEKGMIK